LLRLVIVDECHHVPAVTFERAVGQMPVRRWLGLTANHIDETDFKHDDDAVWPNKAPDAGTSGSQLMQRELVVHQTAHVEGPGLHFQETLRGVVTDASRTRLICDDVSTSVNEDETASCSPVGPSISTRLWRIS